jgi:lysophospholipase L1-like esterase
MGKKGLRRVKPRCLAATCVALTLAAACSSPTTPSPPPTSPPPTPALTISCPLPTTAASLTGDAVPVSFSAPLTSGGRAPVQVSCTRASGSLFPVGTTSVECTAVDALLVSSACSFTVTVNAVPRLSRTKFLAFGDSFTIGEVTNPMPSASSDRAPAFGFVVVPSAAYPTQLTALLRARYSAQTAAIDVVNAGSPGELAADGAKRLPGVLSSTRPEVLLLLEGANELSAFGQAGISRAWAAIDTMAKEGRARGARVFLATLTPSRPGGRNTLPTTVILEMNNRIRTTALGEGAVLVDLYTPLTVDVSRYIGLDGLHPTELGYQKMAETFYDAIRANLEVR